MRHAIGSSTAAAKRPSGPALAHRSRDILWPAALARAASRATHGVSDLGAHPHLASWVYHSTVSYSTTNTNIAWTTHAPTTPTSPVSPSPRRIACGPTRSPAVRTAAVQGPSMSLTLRPPGSPTPAYCGQASGSGSRSRSPACSVHAGRPAGLQAASQPTTHPAGRTRTLVPRVAAPGGAAGAPLADAAAAGSRVLPSPSSLPTAAPEGGASSSSSSSSSSAAAAGDGSGGASSGAQSGRGRGGQRSQGREGAPSEPGAEAKRGQGKQRRRKHQQQQQAETGHPGTTRQEQLGTTRQDQPPSSPPPLPKQRKQSQQKQRQPPQQQQQPGGEAPGQGPRGPQHSDATELHSSSSGKQEKEKEKGGGNPDGATTRFRGVSGRGVGEAATSTAAAGGLGRNTDGSGVAAGGGGGGRGGGGGEPPATRRGGQHEWRGAADGSRQQRGPGAAAPRADRGPEGRGRQPRSLVKRIRSCGTLPQLTELYQVVSAEAEAAARQRAEAAGAAAAAAGLSAGAVALPAEVVWMFLAAAWEAVGRWRQQHRDRRWGAQLRLPVGAREQLATLLGRSCPLVLWAERLTPGKACLLLSLMVACGRFPGAEQHLGLLVEDSLNSLDTFMSGQVALAASSFAKLDYFPGRGWLETMIEVSTGELHSYRPRDLAFLLWSLAKWRVAPPAEWLNEFYAAYEGCCERAASQDLNMVCWALGVGLSAAGWPVRPPERLANTLMMEMQVRMPFQSGQALAHVALGLCMLDVRPPGFWLGEFHEALKTTLPVATSGLAFSNSLWACACWQRERAPGADLLEAACKHSARWLHTLDPRSLAVLLLALADLGACPPAPWVGLALEAAHRLLPSTDPDSAVAVLWAVSRFERQRAMAAAAAASTTTTAASPAPPGSSPAPPPAPPPPQLRLRRRRLSDMDPEELLLLADDVWTRVGGGPGGGGLGGGGQGTAPHLRPPRKWLVRYTPLLQDIALVAAGALGPTTTTTTTTITTTITTVDTTAATAGGSTPDSGGIIRYRGSGAPGFISYGEASIRPAAAAAAATAPPVVVAPPSRGGGGGGGRVGLRPCRFEGLDANQMLDLAVALADLYVYPGDEWMRGHEARMAALAGLPPSALHNPSPASPHTVHGAGASSGAGGGGGLGGLLTPFQLRLLQAAYAALDDTWEGYAAPRGGEVY